jgi:hypothetical protein
LHHLDEDPSNNDHLNLLPLCPNHHLQDIHDPTGSMDPRQLKLFRRFKDPAILDPRFHPLFYRMEAALDSVLENYGVSSTQEHEYFDFVSHLIMGGFYSKKLWKELESASGFMYGNANRMTPPEMEEAKAAFRTKVEIVTVEMLRYQGWLLEKEKHQ